ncbi:hypothetical protein WR25_23707 isoform E [Diploscapter pachys]|uniref:Uncharacterized protein n=1 Tax=Diploscapter pachys TaxID=2018661 RepID=A0A2A2JDS3_9BILA|nr:hypothetical protein WR25_23707 isoform A [Diploscapter pachys]PAV59726.1 hypothetical protein WR25_23707 isoform B [Diploscapter pachys]PAV59727.1 hypothetical protein WR25_23707 isoform C [Diploscapter pachys]PAV59729.1 hypothetical protein WR25_23707 isoform E [Diploscapter pachys]
MRPSLLHPRLNPFRSRFWSPSVLLAMLIFVGRCEDYDEEEMPFTTPKGHPFIDAETADTEHGQEALKSSNIFVGFDEKQNNGEDEMAWVKKELETHFMPFKSPNSESDPSAPDSVPLPPGFIDVEQAKALLSQEEKDKLFSFDEDDQFDGSGEDITKNSTETQTETLKEHDKRREERIPEEKSTVKLKTELNIAQAEAADKLAEVIVRSEGENDFEEERNSRQNEEVIEVKAVTKKKQSSTKIKKRFHKATTPLRIETTTEEEITVPPLPLSDDEINQIRETKAIRGAIDTCPKPPLCKLNCFITINEKGCQDCACIVSSISCEVDTDCPSEQHICREEMCECKEGMESDDDNPGKCRKNDKGKATGEKETRLGEYMKKPLSIGTIHII